MKSLLITLGILLFFGNDIILAGPVPTFMTPSQAEAADRLSQSMTPATNFSQAADQMFVPHQHQASRKIIQILYIFIGFVLISALSAGFIVQLRNRNKPRQELVEVSTDEKS